MRRSLLALVAVGVASVFSAAAHATTVLELDVEALTHTSEWIIEARVIDVAYADLRPSGRGLFTDVTLAVDHVYKGDHVPERYVLRLVGGRGQDGLALTVPGMPTFRVGERVVLFLEKTLDGHVPCGLGQGVWRIVEDERGQPWVLQSSEGLHMMKRGPTGRLVESDPPAFTPALPLEQLIADVYAALRSPPLQCRP